MVHNGHGSAVLKVARHDRSSAALQRQTEVLARLRADDRLATWRSLLPLLLASGVVADRTFLLEGRLPGRGADELQAAYAVPTDEALATISLLHQRTGRRSVVDDALLEGWVDEPAEVLERAVARGWRARYCQQAVGRVRWRLREGLIGRAVMAGWIHGDFWPGNVLTASGGSVSGVVDWDQADERHLGVVDLAHWLLATQTRALGRALGGVVRDRLRARHWSAAERRWLLQAQRDGDLVEDDVVLLLTWLRHVSGNLGKATTYASSPVWVMRNVIPVLRQVTDG
jgi:Ser/Thr protein kinase RdoA (MazF antagonist)